MLSPAPLPPVARHPTGRGTPALSRGADMLKYPVVFQTRTQIRALARSLILPNTTSKNQMETSVFYLPDFVENPFEFRATIFSS